MSAQTAPHHRTANQPTPPGPHPAPDTETKVRAALVGLLLDRSYSSNMAGLPAAVLIAWLLWAPGRETWVLAWLALKLVVLALRHGAHRAFSRVRQHPEQALVWGPRYEFLLFLDGLTYSALGTLFMPAEEPVLAVTLVATLIAASAVALVVLSTSVRAALSITVPMLVPAIITQLLRGHDVSVYLAMGMSLFLLLLVVEVRRAAAHTREMLALRYGMDELAEQRRQALDEASRSNNAKGRFLATMSHEMRTPLHGILGLARLLRQGGQDPEQSQALLATLEKTGEHLLTVINDVLEFSRIENHAVRLSNEPVDLNELTARMADLLRVAAAEKGLRVAVDCDLPMPFWIDGDAARLRQVLLNLIGNAVKFTDHGSVTLRCTLNQSGRCWLEVADSGPGVPEADRERIFKAFEQLDASDARRHGGTGLGLTIARELTRAMGGDIQCLQAPGGGALMRVDLPVRPAPTPPSAPAGPSATDTTWAGLVLLAEDNPVNALVATAVLSQMGLQVIEVQDGHAALERATSHPRPDLVLMDCQMPGLDGFEAAASIRRFEAEHRLPRLPIVALTANALAGDRQRSLAAGMDEHLPKPFQAAELQAVLRRWLAQPRT